MPKDSQTSEERELNEKRRAYVDYINEHKANIITAYKRFKTFISNSDSSITLSDEELKSLENDVMQHDNSKFSEIEFEAYRKHFFPCPFEKEGEKDKENFRKAKLHHYNSNNHHPQNKSRETGLNKVACIHNVLDWIAMSYKFKDKVWEYYNSSRIKDILNPLEKEYIEQILDGIKSNEQYFYDDVENEFEKIEEK